ncbi:hypothetical protein Y032_0148g2639 [Ancylostoma ceylanicum]|uniref:Uncharacterized protein n=1 Tax=Ancylostoma ceylanicum TaxID=53326 RepID=A0A016T236_9BILA|nr:hypothetical protein Y032_0148g2639 [Ancylostoma ceylanicum]
MLSINTYVKNAHWCLALNNASKLLVNWSWLFVQTPENHPKCSLAKLTSSVRGTFHFKRSTSMRMTWRIVKD